MDSGPTPHIYGFCLSGFHQPWVENIQEKKKTPENFKKHSLKLPYTGNHLNSTSIVLEMI